jgi:hypothetical protein
MRLRDTLILRDPCEPHFSETIILLMEKNKYINTTIRN